MHPRGAGPTPQVPPVPYTQGSARREWTDPSDRIETISPFQTTTYSAPQTPDLDPQQPSPLRTQNTTRRSLSSTKSVEMRLHGAVASLNSLQSALSAKERVIKALEADLAHKNAMIEALQTQISTSETFQRSSGVQSTLTALMRKKEKEQERRIAELEEKAKDDKKTIARLQQLNKKLLTEVKASHSLSTDSPKPPSADSTRRLSGEVHRLHQLNTALTKRLDESEAELHQHESDYSSLVRLCQSFEEKTRGLEAANKLLTAHLQRLFG